MKSLFWISGNYYNCQQKWKSILSRFDNPQVEILHCGYPDQDESIATASTIINLLKLRDLFDKRPRIIKMKGIPGPSDSKTETGYKLLTPYLDLVNAKNVLVIDGPIGYRSRPPAKRFNSVKTSRFFKAVQKQGEICEYPTDARNNVEAAKWLIKALESFGKSIEHPVAQRIAEAKGRHLDELYTVALLLRDYQENKKITLEDVETVCIPVFQRTVWDLIESIDRQDCEISLIHLQRFYQLSPASSGFFGDIQQLLGALRYHFQLLLLLKDKCGDIISYKKAEEAVRNFKKQTNDGWKDVYDKRSLGMTVKNNSISNILKLSRGQIYSRFVDIENVRFLVRSKFSNNRANIKVCLDTLIMVLCGYCSTKYADLARGQEPQDLSPGACNDGSNV